MVGAERTGFSNNYRMDGAGDLDSALCETTKACPRLTENA